MTPPSGAGLVGAVLAELAQQALTDQASARMPRVRVVGVSVEELQQLLDDLSTSVLPDRKGPIRVVVAGAPQGLLSPRGPHQIILGPDQPLTKFRHDDDDSGTILVGIGEQPDNEGLRTVFTIGDETALKTDQPDGPVVAARLSALAHIVWGVGGGSSRPPGVILEALSQVFKAYVENDGPPSLRAWLGYLASIRDVSAEHDSIDAATADEIVRRCLPSMFLFPDTAPGPLPPGALRTRLRKNTNLSRSSDPNGKYIDDRQLSERIDATDLAPATKEAMHQFASGDRSAQPRSTLDDWLKAFERPAQPKEGLGSQIRRHIEAKRPELVDELTGLGVVEPLDAGGDEAVAAAERLVSTSTLDDKGANISLYAVLTKALRQRIDRILSTPSTMSDPLVGLLRVMSDLDDEVTSVAIGFGGDYASTRFSRLAFRILYLQTLRLCSDGDTGDRVLDLAELDSDDASARAEHELLGEADTDNDDESSGWSELVLRIQLKDEAGTVHAKRTLAWDPKDRALFVRNLLDPPNGPQLRASESADLIEDAGTPGSPLPRSETEFLDTPLSALANLMDERREFFDSVRQVGLDPDLAMQYVETYEATLVETVATRVPSNAPEPVLDALAAMDMIEMGPRSLMLGVHPLRLRWFASHLAEMRRLLAAALAGTLHLSQRNPGLFFERLQQLRPVATPPLASRGSGYLEPVRSDGAEALFAPMRAETEESAVSIDNTAIDVLARVAKRYLEEFPHKRDGLAVLILDRDGSGGLVDQLVQEIRRTCGKEVVLRVEVAAPTVYHAKIASALSEIADRSDGSHRLVPSFVTVLHDFDAVAGSAKPLPKDIDLAFAPDLFGAQVETNERTRQRLEGAGGRFDPWMGRASSKLPSHGSPTAVLELLPSEPDPLLEAWSTMCVRRKRSSPVGSPESVDYLQMHVNFASQLELFGQLHGSAHWVVTLDEHLGREQFDAIDDPPDVLMVEEAVGANGSFSLTVSSSDGREFVVDRLGTRLGPRSLVIANDPEQLGKVANGLFDLGRNVAPSLMLRALGLGRTAEETIGLVVGRWRLETIAPRDPALIEAWINLDDHANWFGGHRVLRADLLRVVLEVGDTVEIDFEVVESKFRNSADIAKAREQIVSTGDHLQAAFGGVDRDDARFWGHELSTAISQLPRVVRGDGRLISLPTPEADGGMGLVDEACRRLRSGDFVLRSLTGSIVHTNSAGGTSGVEEIQADADESAVSSIRLIRTDRTLLRTILGEIGNVELANDGDGSARAETTEPRVAEMPSAPQKQARGGQAAANHDEEAGGEPSGAPGDVAKALVDSPLSIEDAARPPHEEPAAPSSPSVEGLPATLTTPNSGIGAEGLRLIYQKVLDTYSAHSVLVSAVAEDAYAEGPAFYRLRIKPGTGTNPKSLQSNIDAVRLALELEANQFIRTYIDRGAMVLEVPKSKAQRYPVVAEDLWNEAEWPGTGLVVPFAADMDGAPVSIDFSSSNSPHLLVAGTTGSGKSVALETILTGLCNHYDPSVLRLRLVDPKAIELTFLEEDPHTDGEIGFDADDAADTLNELVSEMERRYKQVFKPAKTRDLAGYNASPGVEPLPWIVCVLDEYADLTTSKDDLKKVEEPLQRLTQKGRAAGIHVILATQRPSADILTTKIRSNLPAKLALRVARSDESRVILDEGGAEALAGHGDALFQTPEGLIRVQCAALQARLT